MQEIDGLFKVNEVNYTDRVDEIDKVSSGVVKSQKKFPIFLDSYGGNKELIFKPLSPSKPYGNPTFAYNEVYWSYLINKIFDERAPRYELAICHGIPIKAVEKLPREKGVLVESYLKPGQQDVNLLEYYRDNPDHGVDIEKYINYCDYIYDYSDIMKSEVFTQRPDLSRRLGEMVLTSMLTRNINFHYENISFICEDDNIIDLAPPIDHEFSTLSISPEHRDANLSKQAAYDSLMFELSPQDKLLSPNDFSRDPLTALNNSRSAFNNVSTIVKQQPEVAAEFIDKLSKMRQFLLNHDIVFQDLNYVGEFNSQLDWMEHYFKKPDHQSDLMVEIGRRSLAEQGRSKIDIVDFGRYAVNLTIRSSNVLQGFIQKNID